MTPDKGYPVTYSLRVEITPRMIADMMCSAFEGGSYGCAYWLPQAKCPRTFKATAAEIKADTVWYNMPRCWAPSTGHVAVFFEREDESKPEKLTRHHVTAESIQRGLNALAKGDPALFGRLLNSAEEPLDAPASDECLQWIVLGEVRYG